MSDTIDKIKTVNSLVRTGILMLILAVVGYVGCLGYTQYVIPAQQGKIALAQLEEVREKYTQLQQDFQQQSVEISKLQTSLKLLKTDRRLANVKIVREGKNEAGEPFLDVEFYEVSGDGNQIGETRPFRLRGDHLYVSCWIVQFEDNYVEAGDPLRAASLCVFKSIWGNLDGPDGGHRLDRQGDDAESAVPEFYREGSEINEFEEKIWGDFWTVSNDPVRQKELGIRASSGVAPFMQVQPGQIYQYEVRASGGVSMKPLQSLPAAGRQTTEKLPQSVD